MALIPFLTVVLKAVALIAAPFVARDLVQVLVAPHINVVLERGSVLDGHSLVQVDLSPTITFGVWVLASFILVVVFAVNAEKISAAMLAYRTKHTPSHRSRTSPEVGGVAGGRTRTVGAAQGKSPDASEQPPHAAQDSSQVTRQEQLDVRWYRALKLHTELDSRWHTYSQDLDAILTRPLMRNLRDPAVADAVRAKSLADNLREERPPRLRAGQQISDVADYLNAVSNYEIALDTAEQKADVQGLDAFRQDERVNIARARRLLALALGPGTSAHERNLTYRRVIQILKKLTNLHIPDTAVTRLAIDAGQRETA